MICVAVNRGSIAHLRNKNPWAQAPPEIAWLTGEGWRRKNRLKTQSAASMSTDGQAEHIYFDSSKFHEQEIKEHPSEISFLRNLVKNDKVIPKTITDFQLLEFLHSVNYNVKAAHKALKVNYKTKKDFPSLFSRRNPFDSEIQRTWKVINLFTLPERTEKGERLVYCGLQETDPRRFNMLAAMKLFTMAVEATLLTEGLAPGYVIILDAKGSTAKHCPLSALPLIRKFMHYIQHGLPINISQVHVVNASPGAEKIFNLIKPFLTKDLLQLILFHYQGRTTLEPMISMKKLHSDLGGNLLSSSHYQEIFKKRIESLEDWYKLEEFQRKDTSSKGFSQNK